MLHSVHMHYSQFIQQFGNGYMNTTVPAWAAIGVVGFIVLMAWSLVWKGLALWRSAQRGEKIWFVIFLLVNTVGILEMIYLFLVTKKDAPTTPSQT